MTFMTDLRSDESAPLIGAATTFAWHIHAEQSRKQSPAQPDARPHAIPYAAHLLGTAAIVVESPLATAEHVAAALLHDSVEDQPQALGITQAHWDSGRAAVQQQLSLTLHGKGISNADRVAELVMEATEDRSVAMAENAPPEEVRADSLRRKAQYRHHFGDAELSDVLVSLADNIYNVRSIAHDLDVSGKGIFDRFNAGAGDKIAHYLALVAITEEREWNDPLVQQFGHAVDLLVSLAVREGLWPNADL
jgi:(p)ppGpp synthase/HD superfamily hydrolase